MKNPIINVKDLLKVANRSICIINFKNEEGYYKVGTGFFVEFQVENNLFRGLMTNNHVLYKNHLDSETDLGFEIFFEDRKEKFCINSNDMNFVFTEELIDITFIQLNDEIINKIDPYYLTVDERECIENDSIMVIQYPINRELVKDFKYNKIKSLKNPIVQELSITNGNIKDSFGINYSHSCSTYFASSGSPLFNSLRVIGIHKSSKGNVNYATKITVAKYAIYTSYIRKYKNEIRNSLGIIKELSNDKIKELEKHRLIQQENNILFKYEGNDIIPSLLFYRTQHAWYWTYYTINYDRENLKHLKWSIIIPHETIDLNDASLLTIHKVLIMWLRISEFMYL